MPEKIPVMFASTKNVSNFGTFFISDGGKQAKAATAFLDWKTKGDETKKSWFCQSAEKTMSQSRQAGNFVSPLNVDGWSIEAKNGMC
jgi:hypothetical protein